MLHPYLLSLIISLFSLYLFTKWLLKPRTKKKLPPSPPSLPILGNLHQLRPLVHRSFQSLGIKYGPIMLLHFGTKPVIIIQSAEAAMEIMKTHDLVFANKPHTYTVRRLFYNLKDISVAPYGEYWRKLKSICVLQLLSNKMVQSFHFIMEEETSLLIKKIKSCSSSGLSVNLSELFMSLTNDVICRSAFGRKHDEAEGGKKFLMLITELLQLVGTISAGEFIPCLSWINSVNGFYTRVEKVAKEVDCYLDRVIQEHMNEGMGSDETDKSESRENFLDILLKLYKNNDTGVSIDLENIKAIIVDIFTAGTDTTSTVLEWAMTELLRHTIVMNYLQKEVREILKDKQSISGDDLEKMHYLKAVVKETLRYHIPIPLLAREASEDVKVMGYDVAAGTIIITNAWAIGRDPASWDEPEMFKPERFLNISSKNFIGLDFELLPFGAGRRRCPGIGFAMANIELVLANLVQKFEWELPEGMKREDLDVMEQLGFTTHRKNPLFAEATHFYF
ncbi:hypothetical protein ACJIZ3_009996 [Penstemon smallii]|uniref:Cytochrome P450 n=1 Tax=Penstemon smallii TaxID=265156 RepID=A0ABD3TEY5_9LAMI